MRKLLIVLLFFPTLALAAPDSNIMRNILPETTSRFDVGTSSKIFNRLFVNYASTTNLSATSLCLTGDTCRTTWPSSGAGVWPFTTTDTNYGVSVQSTTTPLWFKGTPFSLFASTTAVFVNATTSLFTNSGSTWLTGLTNGQLVSTGANGLLISTTTIGNNQLANSTISGIALGGTLGALTNDATLNGSSYTGTGAISDWGINLANENTWTGLQQFSNSTSTLGTITTAWIGTLNLTNDLTVANGGTGASTLTGLLQGNGTGAITGSATINNGNWSGTDLAVANGGTGLSTFGGTNTLLYTSAADTLTSDTDLTWNGTSNLLTLVNASTTAVTIGSFLQIPNTTAETKVQAGAIGLDTTSNQFKIGNGTASVVYGNGNIYPAFTYSTTTAWVASTTLFLGPQIVGTTWNSYSCLTDAGTLNVQCSDGTNNMPMFNASTTAGIVTPSSNNAFTVGELPRCIVGTPASTPTRISCTVSRSITAD